MLSNTIKQLKTNTKCKFLLSSILGFPRDLFLATVQIEKNTVGHKIAKNENANIVLIYNLGLPEGFLGNRVKAV